MISLIRPLNVVGMRRVTKLYTFCVSCGCQNKADSSFAFGKVLYQLWVFATRWQSYKNKIESSQVTPCLKVVWLDTLHADIFAFNLVLNSSDNCKCQYIIYKYCTQIMNELKQTTFWIKDKKRELLVYEKCMGNVSSTDCRSVTFW